MIILCQGNTKVTQVGALTTTTNCRWPAVLMCPTCRHEVCPVHWDRVAGVCSDCSKVAKVLTPAGGRTN